jgi:hypothetical protein
MITHLLLQSIICDGFIAAPNLSKSCCHPRKQHAEPLLSKKKKRNPSSNGRGFGASKISKPEVKSDVAAIQKKSVYRHEAPPAELSFQFPKLVEEHFASDNNVESNNNVTIAAAQKSRKTARKKWGQRQDEVEETELQQAETNLLQTVFRREYQKQTLLHTLDLPRKLVQISSNPLIFTVDNFIDPEACRQVQSDGSGCFRLMFPETLADNLFQGQESDMDGLLFQRVSSTDHDSNDSTIHYPDGLHMDTNGQCLFRHVTCILYLNNVPEDCGGATVFPLGRALPNDPALAASRRLLQEKIPHTRSRAVDTAGLQEEAHLLESRVGCDHLNDPSTDTAIKIQPKAGRLLIFFSRDSSGHEDPRAWHAGERLVADKDGRPAEKRILTLFKEVDYGQEREHFQVQSTLEGYLAPMVGDQRDLLQEMAGG